MAVYCCFSLLLFVTQILQKDTGLWSVPSFFGEAPGRKVMRQRQNRSNQTINFSELQGEYKRVPTPQLPPRFDQRPVWEWGCPARGLIHA